LRDEGRKKIPLPPSSFCGAGKCRVDTGEGERGKETRGGAKPWRVGTHGGKSSKKGEGKGASLSQRERRNNRLLPRIKGKRRRKGWGQPDDAVNLKGRGGPALGGHAKRGETARDIRKELRIQATAISRRRRNGNGDLSECDRGNNKREAKRIQVDQKEIEKSCKFLQGRAHVPKK